MSLFYLMKFKLFSFKMSIFTHSPLLAISHIRKKKKRQGYSSWRLDVCTGSYSVFQFSSDKYPKELLLAADMGQQFFQYSFPFLSIYNPK